MPQTCKKCGDHTKCCFLPEVVCSARIKQSTKSMFQNELQPTKVNELLSCAKQIIVSFFNCTGYLCLLFLRIPEELLRLVYHSLLATNVIKESGKGVSSVG